MKFLFFLVFLTNVIYSQSFDYEYIGVIKLNNRDDQAISYRLLFSEKNGKIEGEAITDLEGKHETKNKIEGTYNVKTKEIAIKETDIIYTKSKFDANSFCFIQFSAKIKIENSFSKFDAEFKGFFPDGQTCANGEIVMVSMKKVQKLADKLTKRIDKSKKISQQDKEKFNPTKLLDTLRTNYLRKDETLNVFVKQPVVEIDIWDNGQIDGDKIDLYVNEKSILQDYTVTSQKKIIPVDMNKKETTLKIIAKNEGKIAPNTAKVQIRDGSQSFQVVTGLQQGEATTIVLYPYRK